MNGENLKKPTVVVALGGNAITKKGEEGNIHQQFANTRAALPAIMEFIRRDYRMVITHGNGPQVGNLFLMVEATHDFIPELPLGVCVADTQGQMGYMIQQSLQNHLVWSGIQKSVVTLVTQVVVDKNDPSFEHPTKPIGKFYTEDEAKKIDEEKGYYMQEDSGRGWRIMVPSPKPLAVVEKDTILTLLENDIVVIAVGGGGIPVIEIEPGICEGVDVVIDKDLASAVVANDVDADQLVILTGVDHVCINYGKPNEKALDTLTVTEAKKLLDAGEFPAGSMGPKIEAAIKFIELGGREVLITSIERVGEALNGKTGTRIYQ